MAAGQKLGELLDVDGGFVLTYNMLKACVPVFESKKGLHYLRENLFSVYIVCINR